MILIVFSAFQFLDDVEDWQTNNHNPQEQDYAGRVVDNLTD